MDTAGSNGFQFQSSSTQSYAIPINEPLNTAKQIKAGTSSSTVHIGPTAFLGILVGSSDSGSSGSGGFFGNGNGSGSSVTGAYVEDVIAGDPAAQAGLTMGDTITSIDGHSVTSDDSLTNALLSQRPGASVSISYVDTSGQQQTTTATLGSGPPQ
jgi:S1-C subfamily serine protease